jgi:DNA-binding XRE family transcriptional regulator
MSGVNKTKIRLIRLQIGCIIKLARLKKGLSQGELALLTDCTSTTIGRIERAEHSSNWEILLLICDQLNIQVGKLFVLKQKNDLLSIVKHIFQLEQKLTTEKKNYYIELTERIEKEYSLFE